MLMSFKVIHEMLVKINNAIDNKEEVLINCTTDPIFGKTFIKVLHYITNPEFNFKLAQINYQPVFDDPIAAENQNTDGIFEMLDYLNKKDSDASINEITYLENISSVNLETIEVVNRILNRYSETGIGNERIQEILKEISNG